MPCYKPRLRKINTKAAGAALLELKCGSCIGCRAETAKNWGMRCMHEKQMHTASCFITLTYNDEHLPENSQLVYRDWQLFAYKLRNYHPFRFYMGGEYGSANNTERPHFHAALFGIDFPDREYLKTSPSGAPIYTSETLAKIWGKGFASVGELTYESANYIARYIMKKRTGKHAKEHYKRVNLTTGEIYYLTPEFNKMSLKPGIGANWFKKYREDVYKGRFHFKVNLNGRDHTPPRYYAKLLEKESPIAWDAIKNELTIKAANYAATGETTTKRLRDKETVQTAKMAFLKRNKLGT